MNKSEFEAKLKAIPETAPDAEDKQALRRIAAATDKSTAPLSKTVELRSGQISLRLPRTLHTDLAHRAELEGISLNQYILYILAQN